MMTLSSCDGTILATDIGGDFDDGFVRNSTVCLDVNLVGLVVEVGGLEAEFSEDISWSVTFRASMLGPH